MEGKIWFSIIKSINYEVIIEYELRGILSKEKCDLISLVWPGLQLFYSESFRTILLLKGRPLDWKELQQKCCQI